MCVCVCPTLFITNTHTNNLALFAAALATKHQAFAQKHNITPHLSHPTLHKKALFAAALATTREFWGVDPTAGKLMLPYVAFLALANALNYNFWKNNPDVSVMNHERV